MVLSSAKKGCVCQTRNPGSEGDGVARGKAGSASGVGGRALPPAVSLSPSPQSDGCAALCLMPGRSPLSVLLPCGCPCLGEAASRACAGDGGGDSESHSSFQLGPTSCSTEPKPAFFPEHDTELLRLKRSREDGCGQAARSRKQWASRSPT